MESRGQLIPSTASVVLNVVILDVAVDHAEEVTRNRSGQHTNQARHDEGVVDHEAADVRRTRAVELKGGQVGRIRRKNVVTVASSCAGNHEARGNTDGESNRNDRSNGGSLRVHELRREDHDQSVGPRILADEFGKNSLEVAKVSSKHCVSHPGHTEHSANGNATSREDRGLGDGRSTGLAEDHDESTASQHEHLDDQRHGEGLLANDRTEFREHTEHSHDSNGSKEDVEGGPLFRTELYADKGGRFAVNILWDEGTKNGSDSRAQLGHNTVY